MLPKTFPAAVLFAAVHIVPCISSKIQWQSCDTTQFNTFVNIDCGTLPVPLDYTAPNSSDKLSLQLIRAPAITQPSKGSILFNFGGPGEPDRDNFVELVPLLLPLTGGEYDLISFDTRATVNTLPLSCYESEAEGVQMLFDYSLTSNSSAFAAQRLWARALVDADLCYERAQENGTLVSTTFTARDLISLVDALDEDGMLRYYGFSYGTTLGFTVAAMFPDRIDKMILDGVQNPQEYYNGLADFQEWTDSDKVFSGIFSTCIAAGNVCPLYTQTATAAQLEQATWDLLDSLKQNPIALSNQVLDYSTLKAFIQQAIYGPSAWPKLAGVLDALFKGNLTQLEVLFGGAVVNEDAAIASNVALTTAISAIHCSDAKPRVASFNEYRPVIDKMYNISSVMGDSDDLVRMRCAQWKIKPKERYEGGFTVQTKNPVLFIGNTWDGHTPLASARNVSSGFNGSVVLEVQAYGHSSLAVASKCTIQKTTAYWANRTLPAPGTVCDVDATPYSNTTWDTILAEIGWNYTTGFTT